MWLFWAILPPAIYAAINFLDRRILESRVRTPDAVPVLASWLVAPLGLGLWVSLGFPIHAPKTIALLVLSGVALVFGTAAYIRALTKLAPGDVALLLQMSSLFALVLSWAWLGETLSGRQWAGFVLLLLTAGAFARVGDRRAAGGLPFAGVLWAILASLGYALNLISVKLAPPTPLLPLLVYETWGLFLGGLALLCVPSTARAIFTKTPRVTDGLGLAALLLSETLFLAGRGASYIAIGLGPVALVGAVGGAQPLFALVYGQILATIAPRLFGERLPREILWRKLSLGALLLFGLWLVSA